MGFLESRTDSQNKLYTGFGFEREQKKKKNSKLEFHLFFKNSLNFTKNANFEASSGSWMGGKMENSHHSYDIRSSWELTLSDSVGEN